MSGADDSVRGHQDILPIQQETQGQQVKGARETLGFHNSLKPLNCLL